MRKGPAILIANAIIWGAVMIGCALKLKGTETFSEIQNILIGGAAFSLFILMVNVVVPEGGKKKRMPTDTKAGG